jgi:hypothetical protein
MGLRVSYSQLKEWKRCRQKWYYDHVLRLTPKAIQEKPEAGQWFHHLAAAWWRGEDWREASEKYWLEKTKSMFQEEMDTFTGIRQTVEGIMARYTEQYGKQRMLDYNVLAVEEEFKVWIPSHNGKRSWTQIICKPDLVVEDRHNDIWLWDHKFTTRESWEEGLVLDEQANDYLWGLAAIHQKPGYEVPVAGIIFDLVRNKVPTVPALLKNGGLSKDKRIDTDEETYLQAIRDNGLYVNDYVDILEHIKLTTKPFFKQIPVYRTQHELQTIQRELYDMTLDMRQGRKRIFRNATADCSWDCPYRELCIMDLKGADAQFYMTNNFNIRP